ncbi:TetR/AcrR family transcriptional regulator [Streptomyces filamentosus]|uniref:TetR/AcrR family transcriptional regulator n=1 Tax=Streptomyces filamentosus TaxID=67294 RepID=UPI0003F1C8F8|nr:TetR family transcriptional regulator [Streptomyces filamentosus NRRL 11379]
MPEGKANKTATEAAAEAAAEAAGAAASARPRRRQARGEARIAQLLRAAADVFCTSGYTASSTNAIAREAGVSPGTLYQFFPNKEAIAVELGDRLLDRWRDTYGAAFDQSHTELPLDRLLDTILDPLIAFNCENPAFFVLMHGSEIPGRITEAHDTLHATMLTRVESVLADYLPDKPAPQIHRIAEIAFMVFKAGLDLVMASEGEERAAYIQELKTVMFRYLDPLVGDDAPRPATTEHINTP